MSHKIFFMRRISLATALSPFANAHSLRLLRGYTAGRLFDFRSIFFTFVILIFFLPLPLLFAEENQGAEPAPVSEIFAESPDSSNQEESPEEAQPDSESEQESNVIKITTKDCPKIEIPENYNELWKQYNNDMRISQMIIKLPNGYPKEKIREKPKELFYTYTVVKNEKKYYDFLNFASHFHNGQLWTIATVNRISSPNDLKIGQEIILPVMHGIFIPMKAENTLEILLQKEYAKEITEKTQIYEIDGEKFYFLPDKRFSPTQIAFFHDTGMRLPLNKKVLTSQFGYRTSPISGTWKFHAGIDLAAPIGTEVYACKSGTVAVVGYNSIYGNYIDIRHAGNTTSRYAHLSKTLVKQGQTVSTGGVIGLVGTTGASTGPHLHFEVRENGTPTDPTKQIRGF